MRKNHTNITRATQASPCGSQQKCSQPDASHARPRFELPKEWDDDAGDGSRLSAAILIDGGSWSRLFIYAFAVKWVDDDGRIVERDRGRTSQEPDTDHDWVREHYAQLSAAFFQQEPWCETELRGRTYVLFAGPMS